jgi:glycosyltransferase involved in cell wall biosynthesis
MAVSSARLINSLRDGGHSVTLLHLKESSASGNVPFRLIGLEGEWLAEGWQGDAERIFFLKRGAMSGAILVGFGGGVPGYLAALWGRWLDTPSVVLFRGNDLDRLIHDPGRGWMVHQTLRLANLVGSVSSEMATRISTLRDGPVLFTPLGIIPGEWHDFPGDHEEAGLLRSRICPVGKTLVGIFGQLKFKKGLATAIKVFRDHGLSRRARLLTVGDLPEAEANELAATCADFWSSEPFLPREKLLPLYLACDIVLIPSLYDGMPNVLLEAMLCGKIVVASNAGGIPDLISDGVTGFLFEAGDVFSAADAIARALALTAELRQSMKSVARQRILSAFTARHEADILENALMRLTG